MQVRKLITELNKLIKKDPSVAYHKVCVDIGEIEWAAKHHKYWEASHIDMRHCSFEKEYKDEPSELRIISIS